MPKFGKAARFDGVSTAMNINTQINSLFNSRDNECTISFWVRSRRDTQICSYAFFNLYTDKITLNVTGTNANYPFSKPFIHYEWNHIAIVKTANKVTVYLNRLEAVTVTIDSVMRQVNASLINTFGTNGINFFAIDLDQYYEYNRALRQEEVSLLYNQDEYVANIGTPHSSVRMADLTYEVTDAAVFRNETDIYVYGGNGKDFTQAFQVYDTITNVVRSIPPKLNQSDKNPAVPRYSATMFHYNGKLFLLGGRDKLNEDKATYKDLWSYSLVTNSWTKLTDIPVAICGHVMTIKDGYIYVIGGKLQDGSYNHIIYRYNIQSDQWNVLITENDYELFNCKVETRCYKNKIVLFGNRKSGKDDVWIYNIIDSSFTPVSTGSATEYIKYSTVQILEKLYVIGGIKSDNTKSNKIRIYDIDKNRWLDPITLSSTYSNRYNVSTSLIANAIFLIGGNIDSANSSSLVNVYFGEQ